MNEKRSVHDMIIISETAFFVIHSWNEHIAVNIWFPCSKMQGLQEIDHSHDNIVR